MGCDSFKACRERKVPCDSKCPRSLDAVVVLIAALVVTYYVAEFVGILVADLMEMP